MGVKIFQKTSDSSSSFIDVTESLDQMTFSESNPSFLLYDCSNGSCIQTFGFVKYKSDSEDHFSFINCFRVGDEVNPIFVGCTKMIYDSGHESCSAPADKNKFNYDYASDTFYWCTNVKIDGTDTYKYLSLPMKNNKMFLFTNGIATFPTTSDNQNVLLKINTNSIALAKG